MGLSWDLLVLNTGYLSTVDWTSCHQELLLGSNVGISGISAQELCCSRHQLALANCCLLLAVVDHRKLALGCIRSLFIVTGGSGQAKLVNFRSVSITLV